MCHSYKLRIVILLILIPMECSVFGLEESEKKNYSQILNTTLPKEVLENLYAKYLDAVDDVESQEPRRRVFISNKEYKIHIKRLKEVNGYKVHNLLVKEEIKPGNPYIYINNPVESKLPNAYLTLDEFKNALTNRVQIQKDAIARTNQQITKRPRYVLKKFKKTRGNKTFKNDSVSRIDITKKPISKTTKSKLFQMVQFKTKEHLILKPITNTITKSSNTINKIHHNSVRHNATVILKVDKRVIEIKSDDRVTNSQIPIIIPTVNHSKYIEDKSVTRDYEVNQWNTAINNSPINEVTSQKINNTINPTNKTGFNDSNRNLIERDTMVSNSTNNVFIENSINNKTEDNYGIVTTNENTTGIGTEEYYSVVSTNNSTEDNMGTTLKETEKVTIVANIEETGSDTEVTDGIIETEATDGMTETEDPITDTTRKTTTVATKRTWKTLGRPAVFMGGDMD